MGRAKTFNEEDILGKAMIVFWQHGYTGTTYALLEKKTGLTSRSLINAYGDKDTIFLLILKHYSNMIKRSVDDIFSKPSTQAIATFFQNIECAEKHDPRNFGCLMINSIFEMSHTNVQAQKTIASFKAMFKEIFTASLLAEKILDAEEKADFLVSVLWGMATEIRMSGNTIVARPTIRYVHNTLHAWQNTK